MKGLLWIYWLGRQLFTNWSDPKAIKFGLIKASSALALVQLVSNVQTLGPIELRSTCE